MTSGGPVVRRRDDRGSAALETVLLAPLLVFGVCFVVWCGRGGQTVSHLEHAADRGARAAALVSRSRMAAVGSAAALSELAGPASGCVGPSAAVSVLADRVVVVVRCTLDVAGLEGLPARIVSATSSEPIDRHRAE
jgi:hypothetical protein